MKFTKDHEWIKVEGKKGIIGISEYAVKHLGDIVFVDMPKVGSSLTKGKTMGVVESVKTVSDIYAPASGKVVKNNADLEADPAMLNQDPHGKAWIIEIELANPGDVDDLMDKAAYDKYCSTLSH
ncbi:MAG TPA: glycine cleavage system protein GcvH [Candidatus Ozemobacteraceae bacterium]|nr:glycine cleavage system protein GcvH [Candidatus Ozemobacteraceae bacterium]